MKGKTQEQKQSDLAIRIDNLQKKRVEIEQEIELLNNQGELAQQGVKVARYRAKGTKNRYWYYQLTAPKAIFPKAKKENEFSRYQHLGVAGSEAHINAILSVARRKQIEELTCINR